MWVITGTGSTGAAIKGTFTSPTNVIDVAVPLPINGRYSVTFTVPTTCRQMEIRFYANPTGTASTDIIDLTGVQLEEGTVMTPFEHKQIGDTYAQCRRYFQRHYHPPLRGVIGVGGTTVGRAAMPLPTPMRVAPTPSTGGTFKVYDGNATSTVSLITNSYITPMSVEFDMNLAAPALGAGRPALLYNDGSNYFLDLSAEL